ncbi:MAG: FkbM family methyltransferase [Pseudomonadota bacterium]
MNLVSKILYRIKLRRYKLNSWGYLTTLLKLKNPNDISINKNQINFKKLELIIDKDKFTYFLAAYEHALLLNKQEKVSFKVVKNKLYICIDNLKFEIQTSEEVFILREIFVECVYNFNTTKPVEDYVVIDIGMNVAIASCYFASKKNISKVISFEPFKPTYNQALTNISLNQLEKKIEAHNFGLGGHDEVLEVEYSPEFRGQVGVHGTDSIKSQIKKTQKEKIEIKDASPVLEKVCLDNNNSRFILKIDCEGAEYELIKRVPVNLLQRTDIIMMEWHIKGPEEIENWLINLGFSFMSFNATSKSIGMIYAIRN